MDIHYSCPNVRYMMGTEAMLGLLLHLSLTTLNVVTGNVRMRSRMSASVANSIGSCAAVRHVD